jgi:hypothetical protein
LETAAPARQLVRARYIKNNNLVHLPVYYTAKLVPPELFYVSGDGQEGSAGALLDDIISAGASYEQLPATGRNIKFEIVNGGGSVCLPDGTNPAASQIMTTAADGIASCKWKLGNNGEQQLKATLLNAAGNPMHIPIIYNADFITSGKKSCSVTVGAKGDFETLAKAFEALKGEKDICICLLPPEKDTAGNEGEHKVDDLRVTGKDSIKISGCGASLLLTGKGMILSAGKIILSNITFVNQEMIPQQIVLEGNDINTEGCTFKYGKVSPVLTPVMVILSPGRLKRGTGTLRFANNVMQVGFTLAVVSGLDAWITDNEIAGEVWLQVDNIKTEDGPPVEFNNKLAVLFWDRMDEGTRKIAEDAVGRVVNFVNKNEALYLRGNRINRIVTDIGKEIKIPSELVQQNNVQMKGFNNAFISDNIFLSAPSSITGDNISMTNNHLMGGNDVTVFFLLGHSGVIMGNIAPNSTGPVETLFDPARKIKAPNICKVL